MPAPTTTSDSLASASIAFGASGTVNDLEEFDAAARDRFAAPSASAAERTRIAATRRCSRESGEGCGFTRRVHVWQYRPAMAPLINSSAAAGGCGFAASLALVGVAWGSHGDPLSAHSRARWCRRSLRARWRDAAPPTRSIGIFPPVRLTVKAVELAEPEGFAAGSAFQARALLVDLDVFALLGRRLLVRRLILDQPMLHLLGASSDGTTNFDGIGRAGAPARPGRRPSRWTSS